MRLQIAAIAGMIWFLNAHSFPGFFATVLLLLIDRVRIRELALQANNATTSAEARQSIQRSIPGWVPSWLVPTRAIVLGLDLQGGSHVLLEVDVPDLEGHVPPADVLRLPLEHGAALPDEPVGARERALAVHDTEIRVVPRRRGRHWLDD